MPASLLGESAAITDQAARTLLTGQIFSIFIITVAAAEIALGVAIVIALYRSRETVFVTDATQLKN